MHLVQALQPPLTEPQIFYDRESIRAGDRWKERLRNEVARCSVFVVLIGPKWLRIQNPDSGQRRLDEPDDWVRTEIEFALERATSGELVVVPTLIDGATLPSADHLPASIASLGDQQALVVRSIKGSEWKQDVSELLALISEHVAIAAPSPLAIDIDATKVDAVHFANEAWQSFTVTNISEATQKVRLKLVVSSVEAVDRVRLRKAGALLREFELRATLDAPGEIDLLSDSGSKLVLAPRESEAFKISLAGKEGFAFNCQLVAVSRDVETSSEARSASPEFVAEFPIRSLELLRARKKETGTT